VPFEDIHEHVPLHDGSPQQLAHSGRQLLSAALHGPSATSAARAAPPVPPARGRAVAAVPGISARRKRVAEVPQFPPARTAAVPRMPTRKHNKVPGF